MPHDKDPLASLDESKIAELARSALVARQKSRDRSQKHRDAKRAAGFVPISVYVPADREAYIRTGIQTIIDLSDEAFAERLASKRP